MPRFNAICQATTDPAPNNPKTKDTVVDVGSPFPLKKSSKRTSVNMTAKKTHMISVNVKKLGSNTPFLATSIMPDEDRVPKTTPKLATIKMVRMLATFDPCAEFKKLTASLLTPTVKSMAAKTARMMTSTR